MMTIVVSDTLWARMQPAIVQVRPQRPGHERPDSRLARLAVQAALNGCTVTAVDADHWQVSSQRFPEAHYDVWRMADGRFGCTCTPGRRERDRELREEPANPQDGLCAHRALVRAVVLGEDGLQ